MPVIRIGNYEIPERYTNLYGSEVGAKNWRSDVRTMLWVAIQEARVPGLEERDSVTIGFDDAWEFGTKAGANPKIAYIIIDGFEDRDDRPIELRHGLAKSLGKVLRQHLSADWHVEVMPKRYNSEREGATMVGPPADPPGTGYLSKRRYKFLVLVFQDGKLDEEVETPVYEFDSEEALAAGLITFAAQNSRVALEAMDLWSGKITIFPPSARQGLGPATTLVIKEVIRVKD